MLDSLILSPSKNAGEDEEEFFDHSFMLSCFFAATLFSCLFYYKYTHSFTYYFS